MTVDQAAYRTWDGVLRPGWRSVAAIAETEIRRVLARNWMRPMLGSILLINIVAAGILSMTVYKQVLGGQSVGEMAEQQGLGVIQPFAIVLRGFLLQVFFFAPVVVALTAGPLIAEDRRARAMPLYFSRPIRHWHYLAGKYIASLSFLLMITVLPPIGMFMVEMSNSPDQGILLDRLALLARGCLPGVLISVVLATGGLAISSLVERSNTATIAIFGAIFITAGMAPICAKLIFNDPTWNALDPFVAMQAIGNDILPRLPSLPSMINVQDVPGRAKDLPLAVAWTSIACWTGAGLALLTLRIRKVEVVT